MNAIISAPREKMEGSTLFLVGFEMKDHSYIQNANSCSMCKRTIINAGIETVIIRDDHDNYRVINVQKEWIDYDESLEGVKGY